MDWCTPACPECYIDAHFLDAAVGIGTECFQLNDVISTDQSRSAHLRLTRLPVVSIQEWMVGISAWSRTSVGRVLSAGGTFTDITAVGLVASIGGAFSEIVAQPVKTQTTTEEQSIKNKTGCWFIRNVDTSSDRCCVWTSNVNKKFDLWICIH